MDSPLVVCPPSATDFVRGAEHRRRHCLKLWPGITRKKKERIMNKRELSKLARAAGRLLLALGFVFSQTAWAAQSQNSRESAAPANKASAQQTTVKTAPSATAKVETEETENTAKQNPVEETASRGGGHEGIKVHGHWTIEVRNPDGTLADRREFENSLSQPSGAQILAGFLNNAGATAAPTPFFWAVTLAGPQTLSLTIPAGPCGTGNPCVIGQSALSLGAASISAPLPDAFNLTASLSGGTFTLGGSVVATTTSNIVSVATSTVALHPQLTSLPTLIYNQFTSTTLANPVIATAGQTVAVTVVISFS
jgi:hypothetical protein